MGPNALVECVNELMRALKEELAERGTVTPAFILLHDSDCEVLSFSPRLFESPEGKAAVARAFRNRAHQTGCLLYTSPSPRDRQKSRMPSSA